MIRLTRDQVLHHIGDIDDFAVTLLIDTGATEFELIEALRSVNREVEEGGGVGPARRAVIDRVRGVLRDLFEEQQAMESATD